MANRCDECLLISIVGVFIFGFCFCSSEAAAKPTVMVNPFPPHSNSNTVPAFPVVEMTNRTCHLDLSEELFGGVRQACVRTLDRSRCCPVLAAWLFAAHARSALELTPAAFQPDSDMTPLMPDDSQKCVDSLQTSLRSRDIFLAKPNSTCDTVLCFCGIRLHQLGSLRCPAAFNLSVTHRNATPTAVLGDLEKNCRNSSYSGCTRCLHSLQKLQGGINGSVYGGEGSDADRANKMFRRDCQLMGLTWLLARNKTAYIPTVSAVLRAVMYSARHSMEEDEKHHLTLAKCSTDQENMPLAVDSLQFEKIKTSSSSSTHGSANYIFNLLLLLLPLLPLPVYQAPASFPRFRRVD